MIHLRCLFLVLLTGCHNWTATKRFWRNAYEVGRILAIGGICAITLVGAFSLRRTLRQLRSGGHAVIDSVSSIGLVGVPCWIVIREDGQDSAVANLMIVAMALYTLFLLVCFVLSVVRWIKAR